VGKRKARRLGVKQKYAKIDKPNQHVYWLWILLETTLTKTTIAQSVTSICVQIYSSFILFGCSKKASKPKRPLITLNLSTIEQTKIPDRKKEKGK